MYPKRAGDISTLAQPYRRWVELARQANLDTIWGRCRAMVQARRSRSAEEMHIVNAVYSESSGEVPDDLDAWECGECGCLHYGREAAEQCCSEPESGFGDEEAAEQCCSESGFGDEEAEIAGVG